MSLSFVASLARKAPISTKATAPKTLSSVARRSYAKKLAGTKTHANLKDAFAGESMVRKLTSLSSNSTYVAQKRAD